VANGRPPSPKEGAAKSSTTPAAPDASSKSTPDMAAVAKRIKVLEATLSAHEMALQAHTETLEAHASWLESLDAQGEEAPPGEKKE